MTTVKVNFISNPTGIIVAPGSGVYKYTLQSGAPDGFNNWTYIQK